jgi:RHS repeat-associated protein
VSGNLLISAQGPNRVVRANLTTGLQTTVFGAVTNGPCAHQGEPGSESTVCLSPQNIVTDAQGNSYVFEYQGESEQDLVRLDAGGTVRTITGSSVVLSPTMSPTLITSTFESGPQFGDMLLAGGNLVLQYNGSLYVVAAIGGPWGTPLTAAERASLSELGVCLACAGDPVDTLSGAFQHSFNDLAIPGHGIPLALSHSYASFDSTTVGPLGSGWTFDYNMSLSGIGSGTTTVNEENGSQVGFTQTGSGSGATFTPTSPRVLATLCAGNGSTCGATGTYTFTRDQSSLKSYTFNSSGQLISLQDANGFKTSVTYPTGKMVVTDPEGRSLTFTYTSSKITSVVDPIGRMVNFAYGSSAGAGGNGNYLTAVTDVRGQTTSFCYDVTGSTCYQTGSGLLRVMTDPDGHLTTNTYDSSGRVTTQTDGTGAPTTFNYSGPVDTGCPLTAAGGTTSTQVTSPPATDAAGNVTVDTYLSGELVCETKGYGKPDAATWQYGYDPVTAARTWTIDPNGHMSSAGFDGNGNEVSAIDADGNTQTWAYNQYNEVVNYSDANANAGRPNGETTTYAYGSSSCLAPATPAWLLCEVDKPVKNATGGSLGTQTTKYGYDTSFYSGSSGPMKLNLTSTVDPNNNTSTYGYDMYGNRTSSTTPAPLSAKTTTTYDLIGRPTSTVTPDGNVSGGNPNLYRSSVAYDPAGNTIATADELAQAVTDSFARAPSATALGSADTGQVWTAVGTANFGISGNGGGAYLATTSGGSASLDETTGAANGSITFNQTGNGMGVVFRGDGTANNYWEAVPVAAYTVWALQEVVGGAVVQNIATGAHTCCNALQVVTVRFSGSAVSLAINGVVAATATDSQLTGNTKVGLFGSGASAGRLTSFDFSAPAGGTTMSSYDPVGNLLFSTDAAGNTTGYNYDGDSRRIQVTRADNTGANTDQLITDYYGDGSMKDQKDATGATTSFTYDHLDQLTSVTVPVTATSTETTAYHYDGAGNLLTTTDPDHRVTTNSYDSANRLKAITYSDGVTPNVSYTYDADGNRLTMTDGTGESSYCRDSVGELLSYTNGGTGSITDCNGTDTAAGDTTSWAYDLAGHTTQITYPHNGSVTNYYDSSGREYQVKDFAGAITSFGFDANSNITSETLPTSGGSTVVTYNYNAANQMVTNGSTHAVVVAQGATTRGSYDYARDPLGQVSSDTSTVGGSVTQTDSYAYSPLNQLTETNAPAATPSYGYDKADNVVTYANGNVGVYNAGNQITTLKNSSGVVQDTYTYNNEGDRSSYTPYTNGTAGTPISFNYDQANRFMGVTGVLAYTYDGDGLRRYKNLWGGVNYFDYDPRKQSDPTVLVSGNATGTSTYNWTWYIYGPDNLVFEQDNSTASGGSPTNTTNYLTHDQLGSTRLVLGANGTVAGTYNYDPYGNASHTGGVSTPMQYCGRYDDPEFGFQYRYHRTYDPVTASFLQRDPLQIATRATYSYGMDSPLNNTDPSGLFVMGICFGVQASAGFHGIGVGVNGMACLVWDDKGQYGILATGGFSFHASGLGLSANVGVIISNAPVIQDMTGFSSCAGGSTSAGGGISVGGCIGPGRTWALEIGPCFGAGAGGWIGKNGTSLYVFGQQDKSPAAQVQSQMYYEQEEGDWSNETFTQGGTCFYNPGSPGQC